MGYISVDDFSAPWPTDSSGQWSTSRVDLAEAGFIGSAMCLTGATDDTTPAFAELRFPSPLDLSAQEELRVWLRATPIARDRSAPFYLRLTARSSSATPIDWERMIPVRNEDSWDFVRMWIGDMPAALRSAVEALRIESAAPISAFAATFFDLVAAKPNAIADAYQSLTERFHNQFQISTDTRMIDVGGHRY